MLEINKEDVKQLNDVDLRELIALLCETEASAKGLSSVGIKWGGSQTASDDGVDVLVNYPKDKNLDGYIAPYTIIQVKKNNMPPKEIEKEMCPKGKLRQFFYQLNQKKGTYIISSGNSDTSKRYLDMRTQVMKDILVKHGLIDIKVDFYDCQRIASWVRSFPAMSIWLKDKAGNGTFGWKPFGNWSNSNSGTVSEYIFDESINTMYDKNTPINIVQGINSIRGNLIIPKSSVRLVGLSGTGKTRLAQALFDKTIGANSLDDKRVIYCDLGDNPEPSPQTMAEYLIALKKSYVLVIDNCPSEVHNSLTKICTSELSELSIITIEYDIKDDQPEETSVFRLEASSNNMIEKILSARCTHLDYKGIQNIAEASGGNARIALAIGGSIQKGENVHKLTSNQLFERLFWQKNQKDEKLMSVAEVCSLVYSFSAEKTDFCTNEIEKLSEIIDVSYIEFFRYVQILVERNLIQKRGCWCAVLPHVLANKLAKQALKNIPGVCIMGVFEKSENERLLTSFTKRLGFLHDSTEAVQITEQWISESGFLHNITNLDSVWENRFFNISSTIPEKVLQLMQCQFEKRPDILANTEQTYSEIIASICEGKHIFHRERFFRLLNSLAYDTSMFKNSVFLLLMFALSSQRKRDIQDIENILLPLFQFCGSGTYASWEQKFEIIDTLISSSTEKEQCWGVKILNRTLSTNTSNNMYHDFGSHHRDLGYWYKDEDDIRKWYHRSLHYAIECLEKHESLRSSILSIIAERLNELWSTGFEFIHDKLLEVTKSIRKMSFWPEGFMQFRMILKHASNKEEKNQDNSNQQNIEKLSELIEILNPVTDAEWFMLTLNTNIYSLRNYNIISVERYSINEYLIDLGKKVGTSVDAFNQVVRTCCTASLSIYNGYYLGKGLAEGSYDYLAMWNCFYEHMSKIPPGKRMIGILSGFLDTVYLLNPDLCNMILDEISCDANLSEEYPTILCNMGEGNHYKRIIKSFYEGKINAWKYISVCYSSIINKWDDIQIETFFNGLFKQSDGVEVAVEVFNNNFAQGKSVLSHKLQIIGYKILINLKFDDNFSEDAVIEIFTHCKSVCGEPDKYNDLLKHIYSECNLTTSTKLRNGFIQELVSINEKMFLNVFLQDGIDVSWRIKEVMKGWIIDVGVLEKIRYDEIVIWIDKKQERLHKLAELIKPFKMDDEKQYLWTDLAFELLYMAENPEEVLQHYYKSLWPNSWSGSRFEIVNPRRKLLLDLLERPEYIPVEFIKRILLNFDEQIQATWEWEEKRRQKEKYANERFE